MCDIKVLTIEMHINLRHADAKKIGDFIYFINYKTSLFLYFKIKTLQKCLLLLNRKK